MRPQIPVVTTTLRPRPIEPVAGRRVFFATTAPEPVVHHLARYLETEAGCEVVGTSAHLSNRARLRADLADAAGKFDLLLTELKAAAVDVVAAVGEEVGVPVVLCDNEPVALDGSDLGEAYESVADLARSRATTRAEGQEMMADRARRSRSRRTAATSRSRRGCSRSRSWPPACSPAWHSASRRRCKTSFSAGAKMSVTIARVREVARDHLDAMAGPQYARRYVRLRDVSHLRRPLIVLIGGTTGVGKSTIATEVAHRLGITRISSTDSIREVMRGIFTADLMPAIHESAFSAWRCLRVPVPEGANPVIVGFREQTAVVSTGIKALIDRAVLEGNSMVIEGIHLVPGYLDLEHMGNARVVELIVAVEDEQSHLSHFYIREAQTEGSRPRERYISSFDSIRLLGDYIERMARKHEIPIIYSHELDRTIDDVLEYVITAAIDTENPPASAGE